MRPITIDSLSQIWREESQRWVGMKASNIIPTCNVTVHSQWAHPPSDECCQATYIDRMLQRQDSAHELKEQLLGTDEQVQGQTRWHAGPTAGATAEKLSSELPSVSIQRVSQSSPSWQASCPAGRLYGFRRSHSDLLARSCCDRPQCQVKQQPLQLVAIV